MQDIYAFDIGDFGTLGLLRWLWSDQLRLGVLWWKTELGTSGADGKHTSYLDERAYELHVARATEQTLSGIGRGERSLQARGELQREDGQRFLEPFTHTAGGAGILVLQALGQIREQPGGRLDVGGVIGAAELAPASFDAQPIQRPSGENIGKISVAGIARKTVGLPGVHPRGTCARAQSVRRYFFASGCQFISSVIGAAVASSSTVLIRKRPPRVTSHCRPC